MYYKYIKESAYKKQGEAERLTDLLQDTDFKEPNVRRAIRANRNAAQPQSEAYGYIWTDYDINRGQKLNIDQILTMTLEAVRESEQWQVFFDLFADDCKKFDITPDFFIIKYVFDSSAPKESTEKMRAILLARPLDVISIRTICHGTIIHAENINEFYKKIEEIAEKVQLLK